MDFGATAEETLGRGTVGLGDDGTVGRWDCETLGGKGRVCQQFN